MKRRGLTHTLVVGVLGGALILVLVVWLLNRGGASAGAPARPSPNVVIVLIDTLRADRLGCYGHDKPTSPRIDALAKESVLFERACAPSPWTLPTVPSLMTSTLPCEHQVLVDGNLVSERHKTLAERLKSLGYATYSFHHNPYAGAVTGLHRGFDVSEMTIRTGNTNGAFLDKFFESQAARRVFLYVHNTEPHNPYEAQDRHVRVFGNVPAATVAEFKRLSDIYRRLTRADADAKRPIGTTDNSAQQDATLRALDGLRPQVDVLYDATVLEADENVGSIIDTLKKRGLWDDTLFILTADHGEEMGEHGGWQHDHSLYEELMHVPLIVRFPHGQYGGKRVRDVVGLIDVLPTVLDALGRNDLLGTARGRSLLPLARGEQWRPPDEPVVYSVRWNKKKFYKPWKEKRGDCQVAVRQGDWKLIYSVEPATIELYYLADDPGEKRDRSTDQPDLAARLRKFAEAFVTDCDARARSSAGPSPVRPVDRPTQRRLEELGYVGNDEEEDEAPIPITSQPASQPTSQASQPASQPAIHEP